ncbi:NADH-ubiquinone oxidoreductase subunitA [Pestalotiopsis fici W106-1]|uniref:NADH dehydrogenase [ubiquinone] iron-sulfur protein 4, mitochondrial n=1 Tax=Pestalotiopsis fici (strain W106-1 / CGMCC3.15140) TaxID=1229662 RepID=W3WI93_PESFW|nr:NADH-ubiquinone oxidoreductase subunitA [Pestalotiopsis fici W106-1]ETS73608.1 NADH-ubiquinone oxidoreductase subunitA [Pestalotiopsis fici W106-1]
MASLRTQSAAKLLRTTTVSRSTVTSFTQRRFKADDASKALTESGPVATATKTPAERAPNSPDWSAHIDKATSTYTPVPKRVLDGSEDSEVLPAAVLSGAPVELQARTVRIYQPAKPATQSGNWGSHHWRMDWDVLSKGHRWENPLMGWQSSGDFMQGTHLNFKSKEDAITFAEKQGYEYFVQEPNKRSFTPKAYANNFLYSPGKLKLVRAK